VVVPESEGVVAGPVLGCVEVVFWLVVAWVVVAVCGAAVVVGVLAEVVVLGLLAVVGRHCLSARSATVFAPWSRLLRSVELRDPGRLEMALVRDEVALATALQFPDSSADEIWSSWLFRLFA
jgi:hypothetical protein